MNSTPVLRLPPSLHFICAPCGTRRLQSSLNALVFNALSCTLRDIYSRLTPPFVNPSCLMRTPLLCSVYYTCISSSPCVTDHYRIPLTPAHRLLIRSFCKRFSAVPGAEQPPFTHRRRQAMRANMTYPRSRTFLSRWEEGRGTWTLQVIALYDHA